MGLGKPPFSQHPALFGLQREIRLMAKRLRKKLTKKLVICLKSVVSCQNSRFWAGPLFGCLKRNEHCRSQGKITDLDGKLQVKGNWLIKSRASQKGTNRRCNWSSPLIHEPKLIILDEPFSGLDPVNTEVLKQVIFEEKSVEPPLSFRPRHDQRRRAKWWYPNDPWWFGPFRACP